MSYINFQKEHEYTPKMLIPVRFKYKNQPLIASIYGIADSLDFRGPLLSEPKTSEGFFCLSLSYEINPFKIINTKKVIDSINSNRVVGFITTKNHKLKTTMYDDISSSSLSILLPEIRKDLFYKNLLDLELIE